MYLSDDYNLCAMSSSRHFDEKQIPFATQKKSLIGFIDWLISVTRAQIVFYCFSLLQIVVFW